MHNSLVAEVRWAPIGQKVLCGAPISQSESVVLGRMIFLVCFLYVFFVGPIAAMNIGDLDISYPGHLEILIFWTCSKNCFNEKNAR